MAGAARKISATSVDGVSTATITIPAFEVGDTNTGAGNYLLFKIGYGNSTNADITPPGGVTFLDKKVGTAGVWGSEAGPRCIAAYGMEDDGTKGGTTLVFTNGGSGTGRVIRVVCERWTFDDTATGWAAAETEVAEDATSGTGFSLAFPSDPGATVGDGVSVTACWVPSTSNVSGGISSAISWPGAAITTALSDSGTSANGFKLRLNTYAGVATGPSSGTPTLTLTLGAAATGVGILVRLRPTGVPLGADAGRNQDAVEPGTPITLDGSQSTGSITGYTWTQTGGETVTLSGSGAQRTFEAPYVAGGSTLTFELEVTDGVDTSDPSEMTVDVEPPTEYGWDAATGARVPIRILGADLG